MKKIRKNSKNWTTLYRPRKFSKNNWFGFELKWPNFPLISLLPLHSNPKFTLTLWILPLFHSYFTPTPPLSESNYILTSTLPWLWPFINFTLALVLTFPLRSIWPSPQFHPNLQLGSMSTDNPLELTIQAFWPFGQFWEYMYKFFESQKESGKDSPTATRTGRTCGSWKCGKS